MKEIKNISIWQNGVILEANKISITVHDNLNDSASFYYTLFAGDNAVVNSSIEINGEDYTKWNGSNDAAYKLVAAKINVTIIETE
jgi:hypothetical protein